MVLWGGLADPGLVPCTRFATGTTRLLAANESTRHARIPTRTGAGADGGDSDVSEGDADKEASGAASCGVSGSRV